MTDTPAGWYPDQAGGLRWWDGARWTEHYQPPAPPSLPPSPITEPYHAGNYLIAILFPIVGVIMAVVRFAKGDIGNGLGLLLASVIAFFVWMMVLTAASTPSYS